MSQISRLKETEIANGNLIDANDINAELNQLVLESNGQDTRLGAIETGTFAFPLVKTSTVKEASSGAGVWMEGIQCHGGKLNARSILAPIASVDTATDQLATATAHGLSTRDTVGVSVQAAEHQLPGGLTEGTLYYVRVLSSTTLTLHLTSDDAGNATNAVNLTSFGSGITYLLRTSGTKFGDIWVDQEGSLNYRALGATYSVMDGQGRNLNNHEYHSAAPKYASPTTFTVEYLASRDTSNRYNICNDGRITVDITTVDLNGVAQSSMSGMLTATSGVTTVVVTGGSGGFVVGDMLTTQGGQKRQVTAVDGSGNPTQVNAVWTTTETNVSFKRNGRCPNTWYYCYEVIMYGYAGLILSARNAAGGQSLDFGPQAWRQMPFAIRLDSNQNILPFRVGSGWPVAPKIIYRDAETASPYSIFTSFSSTAFTTTNLSAVVPPIARLADMYFTPGISSGVGTFSIRETGTALTAGRSVSIQSSSYNLTNTVPDIPLNGSQQFDIKTTSSNAILGGCLYGYTVTEVY